MPLLRPCFVLLLAVLASCVAQAHDPLENTLDLRSSPEALEVVATLSVPSARSLVKKSDAGEITKENFPTLRAILLAAAPDVCALLDADDKLLPPSRVLVSLNHEGEVSYFFEFPAGTRPASLRVNLLASLGAGYFFEVTDRRLSPARRFVLVHDKTAGPLSVPAR